MIKESSLILRMEESEKNDLKTISQSYGMSMSDFARMTIKLGTIRLIELDAESKVLAKAKAINEIK